MNVWLPCTIIWSCMGYCPNACSYHDGSWSHLTRPMIHKHFLFWLCIIRISLEWARDFFQPAVFAALDLPLIWVNSFQTISEEWGRDFTWMHRVFYTRALWLLQYDSIQYMSTAVWSTNLNRLVFSCHSLSLSLWIVAETKPQLRFSQRRYPHWAAVSREVETVIH